MFKSHIVQTQKSFWDLQQSLFFNEDLRNISTFVDYNELEVANTEIERYNYVADCITSLCQKLYFSVQFEKHLEVGFGDTVPQHATPKTVTYYFNGPWYNDLLRFVQHNGSDLKFSTSVVNNSSKFILPNCSFIRVDKVFDKHGFHKNCNNLNYAGGY